MRSIFAGGIVTLALVACGGSNGNNNDDTDGGGSNGPPDACVGLQCQVVNCAAMGQPTTTISGTVFAPNGTLPLYGIQVYVPLGDPGPVPDTLACDRCSSSLPGGAVAQATSGEDGTFRLENVPVGADIPLIITSGKWRRQITIPNVAQCTDTPLAAAETRLPKNKSEGNIPKIAVTTGDADSLECLVRKLGIDDAEITNGTGAGRIHFYRGDGVGSFASGGTISQAVPLWSDVNALKNYDIVFLSCEGSQQNQNNSLKTQAMLDNMKAYADAGGRVFASHWHNIWIGGNFQSNPSLAPAVWKDIATWRASDGNPGNPIAIDEAANPKGPAFANWMVNVMGSTTRGDIELQNNTGRATSVTLDPTKAEMWVKTKQTPSTPQMFQFTTPNEVAADQRCGKVVFTDMHVTGTSNVGNPFPNSCPGGATNMTLTPQEKALAFMFFDIASCVGGIF